MLDFVKKFWENKKLRALILLILGGIAAYTVTDIDDKICELIPECEVADLGDSE